MPTNTLQAIVDIDAVALDSYGSGKQPPREFRVFRAGPNPSTKGKYVFSEAAAKSVIQNFRAQNRRITFDYDHGALRRDSENPAQTAKSAGSCMLELRDGELWAVDCKFTPAAAEGIRNGEWPYFSPAFTTNDKREPQFLLNIALTANPALFSLSEFTEAASALYATFLAAAPDTAAADRLEAARKAAATWATQNLGVYGPAGAPPEGHPAATAPLTFTYPNPNAAGWLGAVEPRDGAAWIAFVRPDGRTALWDTRGDDGSVAGSPRTFQRDLAGLMPEGARDAGQPADADTSTPSQHEANALDALAAGEATIDDDDGALTALQAAHAGHLKAFEALDYNPHQPRQDDGKFGHGSGGGGGHATMPATPVGGGHKTGGGGGSGHGGGGGASTGEMTPVGGHGGGAKTGEATPVGGGSHGGSGGHANPYAGKGGGGGGGSGGSSGTKHTSEHDKREREEKLESARRGMRDESRRTSELAKRVGDKARKSQDPEAHDKAWTVHRAAGTMHRTTAEYDPANAAHHNEQAAHHEREAAYHEKRSKSWARTTVLAIGQRRALGQWSYGRELAAGEGGLAPSVSRRADLASHEAHASRMADAHRAAAKTNRDVAAEHESLRDRHTTLAGLHPGHASTHREEAKAHGAAAKRHIARAEAHGARATALEAQQPATKPTDPEAQPTAPAVAAVAALSVLDDAAEATTARALVTANAWTARAALDGDAIFALDATPDLDWAAVTQPLSGTYPDPAAVGGWLGWVQDPARSWIAFVAASGLTLLWAERTADGATVGEPVAMWRDPAALWRDLSVAPVANAAPADAGAAQETNTNQQPSGDSAAEALNNQPSAGVAEPADTTETTIMHKALSDYAKAKGLSTSALKARLSTALKGNPFAEKCDAALGEDEAKFPPAEEMKAMLKALKTLDYSEDEDSEDDDEVDDPKALRTKAKALRASAKALKAKMSALSAAAAQPSKGESLSIATLSALGVAVGLSADAQPDVVMREALSSVSTTRELCAALGAKSADALAGKIEALKANAEEGAAAVAKLNAYESEKIHGAAAQSITDAEKGARLTPAKKAKAEAFLAAKKYEALSAFLDGCEPVAALGAGPTQLPAETLNALNAAGALPTAPAAPAAAQVPAALPGMPMAPAAGNDPEVVAMLSNADFQSAAKGLGILGNHVEMLSLAVDMVTDTRKRAAFAPAG